MRIVEEVLSFYVPPKPNWWRAYPKAITVIGGVYPQFDVDNPEHYKFLQENHVAKVSILNSKEEVDIPSIEEAALNVPYCPYCGKPLDKVMKGVKGRFDGILIVFKWDDGNGKYRMTETKTYGEQHETHMYCGYCNVEISPEREAYPFIMAKVEKNADR